MVEVDRIYESKVKFAGLFDFKSTYEFMYNWLTDYGFGVIEEKTYNEKIKPEGKEVEIIWNARKKVSDYFRFYLNIRWFIVGMTSVEVEKGGQKFKMNKGISEIKIIGFLEKDYEHRWETSAFSKFLRGVYDRYVIRSRIDEYSKKIMEEVDEFVASIKSFFELEGIRPRM